MAFFEWLDMLPVSVWVRESLWAYPIIITSHALGMAFLVGTIVVINLRLLGLLPGIPVFLLPKLLPLLWLGFAVNATSGTLLFMADAVGLVQNPVFIAKLGLIVAGFLLALVIRRMVLGNMALWAPGNRVPAMATLFCSLSLLGWFGAIVAGRYTAYMI